MVENGNGMSAPVRRIATTYPRFTNNRYLRAPVVARNGARPLTCGLHAALRTPRRHVPYGVNGTCRSRCIRAPFTKRCFAHLLGPGGIDHQLVGVVPNNGTRLGQPHRSAGCLPLRVALVLNRACADPTWSVASDCVGACPARPLLRHLPKPKTGRRLSPKNGAPQTRNCLRSAYEGTKKPRVPTFAGTLAAVSVDP